MSSEQDVDRELRAALSVSPSPDFEARVLQRVEADHASRWPVAYGWLAAAASLVVVASAFYGFNRPSVAVERTQAPQIAQETAPTVAPPQHEAAARESAGERHRVDTVRVTRHESRNAEPEVLVPPNQMEAVRRLVRAVNEGRVAPPMELPQGPMAPPAQLGVAPLVVEPIPLSPLGSGVSK